MNSSSSTTQSSFSGRHFDAHGHEIQSSSSPAGDIKSSASSIYGQMAGRQVVPQTKKREALPRHNMGNVQLSSISRNIIAELSTYLKSTSGGQWKRILDLINHHQAQIVKVVYKDPTKNELLQKVFAKLKTEALAGFTNQRALRAQDVNFKITRSLKEIRRQVAEKRQTLSFIQAFLAAPRARKIEISTLFFAQPEDIKRSIATIRAMAMTDADPNLLCDMLSAWIDAKKIPWTHIKLELTDKEVAEVASRITYLNLGFSNEYRGFDDATLETFLRRFPKIKHLTISSWKITKFPDQIKGLISLDCSECSELSSLPKMPNLKSLSCCGCKKLGALPAGLTSLEFLSCFDCMFKCLPDDLVALKELECQQCPHLIVLPHLPALKLLDCSECPLVLLPSGMTALEKLICDHCEHLKELPDDLAALKCLHCSGCPKLLRLPEKLNLKALTELLCRWSEFKGLARAMPALEILDCRRSKKLILLPDVLPAMRYLNCTRCPLASLSKGMTAISILECDKKLYKTLPAEYKHAVSKNPRALNQSLYDHIEGQDELAAEEESDDEVDDEVMEDIKEEKKAAGEH